MTRQRSKKQRRTVEQTLATPSSQRFWHAESIRQNVALILFALALAVVFVAIMEHPSIIRILTRQSIPSGLWLRVLGEGSLGLFIFLITFVYLARLEERRRGTWKLLITFGVLALLFTGAGWAVVKFEKSPYLIPLSAASILFRLLDSRRTALVLSALLALLLGLTLQIAASVLHAANGVAHVPYAAVIALFGGAALVALELAQVRTRVVILEAGVSISALQIALLLAAWAAGLYKPVAPATLTSDIAWAAVNGVAVGVAMTAGLPFIERLFSTTTEISLLELSDQNLPLMRRMLLEAPGTYHHSFIVGTLSEAAAEVIGANSLMARVGAYYHDIGKLNKPEYFVENSMPGVNPHDHLNPTMSSLIISAHPKDGVELAKDYGLPPAIVDIIAEHHGNCLIEFFYQRSLNENSGKKPPDDSYFRYPGPRPQTKEAGIVMLGDAVEAASRTLTAPSAARLRRLVHELSMKRLLDGQFDDSGLTLHELDLAEESFVRTLCSLFHARIRYPEQEGKKKATAVSGKRAQ